MTTDRAEQPVEALAARFPARFGWGAATSAYQIEGGAKADGRGTSIWDTFSARPGRIRAGATGAVACDHYHRWPDDLDLMAGLGLRSYRFSVAWPRIQPLGRSTPNAAGLDFYDRLVDGLLERGIEPWVTLYHWDLPQPLEDTGGWLAPDIVERFAEFAGIVAGRLGDRVHRWITLNEPRTFAFLGYGTGVHAPGREGWENGLRAAHHAHLAHAAAVPVLRGAAPAASVGICHDLAELLPAGAEDAAAVVRHDGAMHRWFLDPTFGRGYPADLVAWYEEHGMLDGVDPIAVADAPPIDFLALNYYRRERIADAAPRPTAGSGTAVVESQGEHTATGWEIWPDGLRAILCRVTEDYAPRAIAVTENGAAFPDLPAVDGSVDDEARRVYLERHLSAAADALDTGVPLVAYFVWSLLDNFEWSLGYDVRFGIVRVDFATQRRILKASGRWYRSLLRGA